MSKAECSSKMSGITDQKICAGYAKGGIDSCQVGISSINPNATNYSPTVMIFIYHWIIPLLQASSESPSVPKLSASDSH